MFIRFLTLNSQELSHVFISNTSPHEERKSILREKMRRKNKDIFNQWKQEKIACELYNK